MMRALVGNSNNSFYRVEEFEIQEAEEKMGVIFPMSLRELYLTIGYGFLESVVGNINRLMDPSSVAEFRLSIGQYEGSEEMDDIREDSDDKVVFFEINESAFISIGFEQYNLGKIYYYNTEIAKDLESFFNRYLISETYFE